MNNGNGGSFALKKKFTGYGDMFKSTDPDSLAAATDGTKGAIDSDGDSGVTKLRLEFLRPYKNHPFKPYGGQRFDDMVQSVRDNGVIMPVIVRVITERDYGEVAYEILSGHNRVAAARAAGFEIVPAIVREGLSDEDALLIVTETNLIQRSFADMSHSERAVTLYMHHEAIKKQGKRTDLISEIESMLNACNDGDCGTCSPLANKLKAITKIGDQYDMSKDTVARYLRVNRLIAPFKERLDSSELAIRAAVTLSYLSADEQQAVEDILVSSSYKVDMKKAEALRTAAERRKLDHAAIEEILSGAKKPKAPRPAAFKLKPKIVSRYFTPEQKPQEIEDTITKALEYYFTHVKDAHAEDDHEEYGYDGEDELEQ